MSSRLWRDEVREACVRAALEAYEEGGMRGLCAEGRFELAVGAIRALDLDALDLDATGTAPVPIGTAALAGDARVRRLGPDDARALFALRIRAVREHPRAFLVSVEEDEALGVDGFAQRLAQPADRAFIVGGFAGGELAAMAGVARQPMRKSRHRAVLWGVYVAPEHRGSGLGRAVVARAIEDARAMEGVETLVLSVDARNEGAYSLYRALGFAPWTTERDAFRAEGEPVDEVHMMLSMR